eukprot:220673_1
MSFTCDNCHCEHAKLRCTACKKAHYCKKKCQKSHWKIHKQSCTFKHTKPQRKWPTSKICPPPYLAMKLGNDGTGGNISENDMPFNSIPTTLFNLTKFISFLSACNPILIPELGKIIFQILTGYSFSMNLSNNNSKIFFNSVSKPMKTNIDVFMREHTNPSWTLQNWTHFNGECDQWIIMDKLNQCADSDCIECGRCLQNMRKFCEECKNSEDPEDFNNKLLHMELPLHVGYNWEAHKYYVIHWIRDTNIGAITIALTTLKSKEETLQIGYNQFLIATFKSNDILPYFDGIHYAYLLKYILEHYGFDELYYSRIWMVGFSWSITHDVDVRNEYLDTVREIFNENVETVGDYFKKPRYSGASVEFGDDQCQMM